MHSIVSFDPITNNKSVQHRSLAASQNEDDKEIKQSKNVTKSNMNDKASNTHNEDNNSIDDNYSVSPKNQLMNDSTTTSFAEATADLMSRPHELSEHEINNVLLSLSKVRSPYEHHAGISSFYVG